MKYKFDDMNAFWEFIKAQGVQTAFVWDRLPNEIKEQIRAISPSLTANLEALSNGNKTGVRK